MLNFNRKWVRFLPLALCVTIAPMAWADLFNLDSVDFVSSGDKTNIVLHTGSIVPYQKILVSDNKLIFDIDQVSTENTVRTNFSGAANISHVIVQPLNDHKIRMIVRGENLGTPTIAFTNPGPSDSFAPEDITAETTAALNALQSDMTQPAVLEESVDETAIQDATDAPIAMSMTEEAPVEAKAPELPKPLTTTTAEPEASSGLLGGMDTDFFNLSAGSQWNQYVPYGILGFLILGAGLFIRRKLQMMSRQTTFEDLIEEQSQGKKVGFREMATAYRAKTGKATQPERPVLQDEEILPSDSAPIGLRGLGRGPRPEVAPRRPVAAEKPVEQKQPVDALLAASLLQQGMQKTAMKTPAPKKQALNNYLKQKAQPQPKPQNNALAAKQPRSREVADQLMRTEEIKRAQTQQHEVVMKKPARPGISSPANPMNQVLMNNKVGPHEHVIRNKAKKPGGVSLPPGMNKPASRPARQGQPPLPGNPEVLDFLRNVAELMEKDGKPNIAQSIQRNLGPA